MKNKKLLILSLCLLFIGCILTSCTEEEVIPAQGDGVWKEGNITGVDDWQNQV